MKFCALAAVIALLFLSACGGGSSSSKSTSGQTATTYTIGGTITGLTGTGLVLQDNGGNNLTIAANATTFAFSTAIDSGSAYSVSIMTQPTGPVQKCTVSSASGTANANVTNVAIACTTTTYTISGTVSGLSGKGLSLQDNGGDTLAVTANGSFTFATALDSGAAYKVTVSAQPTGPVQNCVVTNGSGNASANVSNVAIACTTTTFTIGGTISGLTGTGLTLQDNGGDNVTVAANSTSFTFPTALDSGAAYSVTVSAQPTSPAQTCVVTSGTGTASANVTSVQVACANTPTYTVGGTVSNLLGSGLVLQDNGGNNLTLTAGQASFTFSTPIVSGGTYNVTVLTQPTSPAQNCVVTGGNATVSANVTNVAVACTTTTYTIGGTISGLGGSGLVLQDNSGDNLTVTPTQTSFTFATALDSGAAYSVSVLTQPINSIQTCTVASGTGNATANVTSVAITCANVNEWAWEGGPMLDDEPGVYGTLGQAASTNIPGGRYWSVNFSDASGNLWLFGGYGYDKNADNADLNDLWEYSPTTGEWTWVGGGDISGDGGTYGTEGTAAAGNIPGARDSAVSWTDSSGNFWLFGGHGYDSVKTADDLNDLWEYNISTGQWTWISGSNVVDQIGTYGTLGTGAVGNVPGARYSGVSWTDKQGNFWLFGGYGYDSAGTIGYLNDIWEGSYNSSNQWIWTWQGGSNLANATGSYTAPAVPSSRYLSTAWTDPKGNLWLYAGFGPYGGGTAVLTDLWEYNTTTLQWTWVGGSQTAALEGVYGTLGVAASTNMPGSRKGAVGWTDSNGDLWVFGGVGVDSANKDGELNDLWQYNVTTGEWTWEAGSNLNGAAGTYGQQGTPAPGNAPGARGGSPAWIDSSGDLWLFGGNGPLSGVNGSFNDLWKFEP